MRYEVSEDVVSDYDNRTERFRAEEQRIATCLIGPGDVQRWINGGSEARERAKQVLEVLLTEHGATAVLGALQELGLLVEPDRWEDVWG